MNYLLKYITVQSAIPTLQMAKAKLLFKNFSLGVHLEPNQLQIRQ